MATGAGVTSEGNVRACIDCETVILACRVNSQESAMSRRNTVQTWFLMLLENEGQILTITITSGSTPVLDN